MNVKKAQSLIEFGILSLLVLVLSLGALFLFGGSLGDLFEKNNVTTMNNATSSNITSRTAFDPDN